MRILLAYQPVDGGVARHVADIASGLLEIGGHEVTLCGPLALPGQPSEAAFARLGMTRAVEPVADLRALGRFARIVARVRPDVIHAHSSKAGALARAARIVHPRTPVYYTPHGYAFAGYFAHEAERRAYREVERVLAPLSSRVLCVCESEAALARSIGRPDNVRVVYNGIDPIPQGPVDHRVRELAGRGPLLCTLTLLRPGKGIETLIDALSRVRAHHPGIQLAIGGEGPDRDALHVRARDAGLSDVVHFLGPVEDPASLLRGADIFVYPSWAEAFPYVILEAMSAGLPIVASSVGGIREALPSRRHGFLVPPRDSEALASALLELLDQPGRRADMGREAKARMERHFTRAAMVENVLAAYREVVRSHGA